MEITYSLDPDLIKLQSRIFIEAFFDNINLSSTVDFCPLL